MALGFLKKSLPWKDLLHHSWKAEPVFLHPMIHCTNCGHLNQEGASQCEACYEPLPSLTSCPTCQASVPDDAFFCPQCGASLPRGVSNPGTPGSGNTPAPPVFDELPPTNVVAQEALGASPVPPTDVVGAGSPSDLPPTNVVHPGSPSDLPPTNVVNPPAAPVGPPSDLPPTNVVNPPVAPPSDLPPTNVVHPPGAPVAPPSDLPPTNVVNPPAAPVGPPSDLPPTNVVHPPVAETLPPRPATPPSDLPPTNVVHPPEPPVNAAEEESVPTIPPSQPPAVDDVETSPTLVVSPGASGLIDNSAPPAPPVEEPVVEAPPVPDIPPTMPPQPPVSFETPAPVSPPPVSEPTIPPVSPPPISAEEPEPPTINPFEPFEEEPPLPPQPETISEPITQAHEVDETPKTFSEVLLGDEDEELTETFVPLDSFPPVQDDESSSDDAPDDVTPSMAATTMQPFAVPPSVGETVIQQPKPIASLLHERSNTSLSLPSNKELLLIGKTTETIAPDIDVSEFADSDVVSRRHAAIFVEPDGYSVEDLGSSNGTFVNGEPANQGERSPIQPGDRICLGREEKVCFIFQLK